MKRTAIVAHLPVHNWPAASENPQVQFIAINRELTMVGDICLLDDNGSAQGRRPGGTNLGVSLVALNRAHAAILNAKHAEAAVH